MREILRLTLHEVEDFKFESLDGLLIGKGILNNSNIVRVDDPLTGEIIFYEKSLPKMQA